MQNFVYIVTCENMSNANLPAFINKVHRNPYLMMS